MKINMETLIDEDLTNAISLLGRKKKALEAKTSVAYAILHGRLLTYAHK